MRKHFFIVTLFLAVFCFSQTATRFSLEGKGNLVFPTGNNFIKDGLKNFVGFGIGFQAIIYKGLGAGVDFNRSYADVKNVSVFGDLLSSTFTEGSVYLVYQYPVSTAFKTEGLVGYSYITLASLSQYRSKKFKENSESLFLGAKFLYAITADGKIQVFAAPKVSFFSSDVRIENPEFNKYYSKATLVTTSLGIRFNF